MNRLIEHARRIRPLFLIWCIALLVALPIIAQGATTLLSDGFEDGNANGWSPSGGSWSVVADGSRVYKQSSTSADAKSFVGSTSWTNQAVEAKVKPLAFNGTNRTAGVLARGNINVNTEDPIVTNGSVVEPRTFYTYTPDNAADIPTIVSTGAGVGRVSG